MRSEYKDCPCIVKVVLLSFFFIKSYSELFMLFHLNLPSNVGSIAFKMDLSIILIRGDVSVKGRLSVDPGFFGMETRRIFG